MTTSTTPEHFTAVPAKPIFVATTEEQILAKAADILERKFRNTNEAFTSVRASKDYCAFKLGNYKKEVFSIMLMDNQHRLIEFKELFYGTIDQASVYPREVAVEALRVNAAAIILVHNHPSGNSTPSSSDKAITQKLTSALELIGVRVLDHIIVGARCTSFAELGLI